MAGQIKKLICVGLLEPLSAVTGGEGRMTPWTLVGPSSYRKTEKLSSQLAKYMHALGLWRTCKEPTQTQREQKGPQAQNGTSSLAAVTQQLC